MIWVWSWLRVNAGKYACHMQVLQIDFVAYGWVINKVLPFKLILILNKFNKKVVFVKGLVCSKLGCW